MTPEAFKQIKDIVQQIDNERDVIRQRMDAQCRGKWDFGKRDVTELTPTYL